MPYADPTPQYFTLDIKNNSVKDVMGYYVTTSDNGTTNVFRKVKNGTISNLGEIPKNKPFKSSGYASKEELQYLSANYNKIITEQTVPMIRRSIGGQAGGGNAKINQILGTNLASVAPPTREEQATASVDRAVQEGKKGISPITISANYRTNYDVLYYPKDLEGNGQDRIKFIMGRKSGSSINTDFNSKNPTITANREFKSILGSVTLPVQPSITDSNTVDWSGAQLNAIQAYAASAGVRMIGSTDATDLASQVGTILGKIAREVTIGNSSKDIQNALKIYFAQEAVGAQNLLSRASGAILNPNLELLFNGPSLRPFSFTFRLSPRDQTEAEQVRKIIRFFKQGMSVKTSSSNIFLQSPNIFEIDYITFDENKKPISHPSINRIKTCALLSCDVDYTPDGTYMTYNEKNRSMTSYQLSLRFSELDPIYDSDYQDIDGTINDSAGIGY